MWQLSSIKAAKRRREQIELSEGSEGMRLARVSRSTVCHFFRNLVTMSRLVPNLIYSFVWVHGKQSGQD